MISFLNSFRICFEQTIITMSSDQDDRRIQLIMMNRYRSILQLCTMRDYQRLLHEERYIRVEYRRIMLEMHASDPVRCTNFCCEKIDKFQSPNRTEKQGICDRKLISVGSYRNKKQELTSRFCFLSSSKLHRVSCSTENVHSPPPFLFSVPVFRFLSMCKLRSNL